MGQSNGDLEFDPEFDLESYLKVKSFFQWEPAFVYPGHEKSGKFYFAYDLDHNLKHELETIDFLIFNGSYHICNA